MSNYAQKLADRRTIASKKERGLREAYGMELLSPEQMRASLRELAQDQIKEVGLESYH